MHLLLGGINTDFTTGMSTGTTGVSNTPYKLFDIPEIEDKTTIFLFEYGSGHRAGIYFVNTEEVTAIANANYIRTSTSEEGNYFLYKDGSSVYFKTVGSSIPVKWKLSKTL